MLFARTILASLVFILCCISCIADPGVPEVLESAKSDDLAGRKVQIRAHGNSYQPPGILKAQIELAEADDYSLEISSLSSVITLNASDYELKQPNTWTHYGYILSYRKAGSTQNWKSLKASQDGNTNWSSSIFKNASIVLDGASYLIHGTAVGFVSPDFQGTTIRPTNNTSYKAYISGIPQNSELRITPIPVFRWGNFSDDYSMEYEIEKTTLGNEVECHIGESAGQCIDTNVYACNSGSLHSGACPGAANIRCCIQ